MRRPLWPALAVLGAHGRVRVAETVAVVVRKWFAKHRILSLSTAI